VGFWAQELWDRAQKLWDLTASQGRGYRQRAAPFRAPPATGDSLARQRAPRGRSRAGADVGGHEVPGSPCGRGPLHARLWARRGARLARATRGDAGRRGRDAGDELRRRSGGLGWAVSGPGTSPVAAADGARAGVP